jgi:hypothetical protein
MKLSKDIFNRSEINLAGEKIKNLICDFIIKNDLSIYIDTQDKTHLIIQKVPTEKYLYQKKIKDISNFIFKNYNFLDQTNKPTHYINITPQFRNKFYTEAFNNLKGDDKIFFIKGFVHFNQPIGFLSALYNNLPESDFWLHLRHITPFQKSTLSSTQIREVLKYLEYKKIDTEEKIEALAYYIQYFKPICKRTDIKANIIRLIKDKIDESHFEIFETLLDSKIEKTQNIQSILEPKKEVIHISLLKNKIFEQLEFPQIKQIQTQHYNSYIIQLNSFLTNKENNQLLNIDRIDFNEFNSGREPARIYFVANEKGFHKDIIQIYLHLLETCAVNFNGKYSINLNHETPEIHESFKKSLNYYLLSKEIGNEKKQDKQKNSIKI